MSVVASSFVGRAGRMAAAHARLFALGVGVGLVVDAAVLGLYELSKHAPYVNLKPRTKVRASRARGRSAVLSLPCPPGPRPCRALVLLMPLPCLDSPGPCPASCRPPLALPCFALPRVALLTCGVLLPLAAFARRSGRCNRTTTASRGRTPGTRPRSSPSWNVGRSRPPARRHAAARRPPCGVRDRPAPDLPTAPPPTPPHPTPTQPTPRIHLCIHAYPGS